MNFHDSLIVLKAELNSNYPIKSSGTDRNLKRFELINRIQKVTMEIMQSISKYESPVIKTINHKNWQNCYFNKRLTIKKTNLKKTRINFLKHNGHLRFRAIFFLLSKIHKLLLTCKTSTRRELYYTNREIFKTQKEVDENMKDVAYILNSPAWELGVLSTSKGIVSGPLLLHLKNGESINCNKKGGVSIPSNVSDVENISSSAELVLLIEKDASFQKIIDSNISSRLGPCIFLTGKGFPDIGTRMLVCKFWENLRIPILALNDADPYGFEIMCIYRFGSLTMSSYSKALACPAVRWIGIHPTDIKPLLLDSEQLSMRDIKKIEDLMQRSYIKENNQLKKELQTFLDINLKAEIEGVSKISTNYLMDIYVRNKISCREYY